MEKFYYVYMIRCADGTLYTGSTDDVERRFQLHSNGKGAKYTRGRGPLTLVYSEKLPTWSDALKREHAIKKLTRAQKEQLIANYTKSEADL